MTSPDKTRACPPSTIIDNKGVVCWIRYDGVYMRDLGTTNGHASALLWYGVALYAKSPTAPYHWFKQMGVSKQGVVTWQDAGATDPVPPPPPPAPAISGFAVTPTAVTAGQSVVLSASVANATSVTLDGVPINLPCTVTPASSRSYQIVANGAAGTTPATSPAIAVTVNPIAIPPGTSPDGTTVPGAASIITASGDVWRLAGLYATDPPNMVITRNGVAIDRGVLLVYQGGVVWFQYSRAGVVEWWQWDGAKTVAAPAGPPGFYMEPVFSFPDPLSLALGVPVSLKPYVRSTLPLVFTPFDNQNATLDAAGQFTQKVEGTITDTVEVDDGH